jgi:predicted transcriptional regulator
MTVLESIANTQLGYTDTDLPGGTTYHYAVAAINDAGEGPMCQPVVATTYQVPSAPADPSHLRDEVSVRLDWGPPLVEGGSPVLSYRVYRGSTPDSMAFLAEVFDQTEYEDRSAVSDLTYYYAVSAVTAVGEGHMSEPLTVGPAIPQYPPGPPLDLTVEVDGLVATLRWLPPASDGGSPVTGYVVLRGLSSDDLTTLAWLDDVLRYEDTSLEEDRTYFYSVAAVNDVGHGDPSSSVKVDVEGEGAVLGIAPSVLVAIAALLTVAVVAGLGYAFEPFKYSLVLLFLPLFSRFSRENVLDNKNRYIIHGYIIDNPGVNFSGICEEFDLPLGVATYHLDVLERENFVQSVRDGRLKRFYSTDTKVPNGKMRKTPEEIRTTLLDIVSAHPGVSQKELIRELGIDRETVGYHIRILVKEGFIVASKKGRYTVYKVTNPKRYTGS